MASVLPARRSLVLAGCAVIGTIASTPICNAPTVFAVEVVRYVVHNRVVTPERPTIVLLVSNLLRDASYIIDSDHHPVHSVLP